MDPTNFIWGTCETRLYFNQSNRVCVKKCVVGTPPW